MKPLQNDRLIKALLRQPTDCTPIWIMRQAGRYLPEYLKVRAEAGSFMKLCQTPELACEVTLQPLRRFDLDAAILFSDILTIPDAMGLGLDFVEGEGPVFRHPIQHESDVKKLIVSNPDDQLSYVIDAVKHIKVALEQKVPLIGFSGSPWTLACYMIEGQATRNFFNIKKMLYTRPDLLSDLLTVVENSVVSYLNAQINAGVDAVMIFDTWGGILNTQDYYKFSLRSMKNITEQLIRERDGQRIPSIIFTKNSGLWLEAIAESGCDAMGVDWLIDIGDARQRVGNKVALQGNLDPSVLLSTPEIIQTKAAEVLKSFGDHPGHVFNLGHGIDKTVPPEHVKILVDTVHSLSKR